VILPLRESLLFINQAENNGLYCQRRTFVKPRPEKKPVRVLLEFGFFREKIAESTLTIEKNGRHNFTKEYIELTRDFYPNFYYF
jgi:tRNA1Val (adenine37-N6)-methyltransferase